MTTAYFDIAFDRQPLMGVFRNLSATAAVARAERAWDAGVRNVEIPVQSTDALPTLRAVVAAGRERGLDVGAGTVVDVDQFAEVSAAGAAYTVSPGLDADIVRAALERGIPHLPGVATPSEILTARRLGLRWLKAFPASVLGADWIRAMRGPFPDVRFVATGGMVLDAAPAFLAAGVGTVALGDAFDDDEACERIATMMRDA
ncbi:bifunctional 4-hydroxy-2-oxoglutarate aldolase/2-dehydro-3-deoxy-phosphogluconate aldolase [Microbacterium sp. HMH0099]|uniref:bifunctional 4-hydroxy-2-oxoglutarate aldolase/2-dehydro-3-deoxy-phosphogluconate aldolase n=1 Tax=Microbacterium sp. HMH0099 TaxID=3414026 RepID=UPI003BF6B9FB